MFEYEVYNSATKEVLFITGHDSIEACVKTGLNPMDWEIITKTEI